MVRHASSGAEPRWVQAKLMSSRFHPWSVRASVGVSRVRESMERQRFPSEVYPSRLATCATVTERSDRAYATAMARNQRRYA